MNMENNVLDVVEIKDEDDSSSDELSRNETVNGEEMDYDPVDRIRKELMEFDDNFELDRPHYVNIDRLFDDDDGAVDEICPYCMKPFRADYIKTHIEKHTGQLPFICKVCNKGFKASNYLSLHMATHRQVEYYHCKECNKTFNYIQVYKRHMRIHEGDMKYNCDRCAYVCHTSEKLREHKINHEEQRTVPCDQCDRMFKDVSSLRRHQQVHAMDGYTCDICLKVYCKQRYLTRHIRRSHMNAPLHACNVCPFSTNNIKTFKSHLQKHDDESNLERFKCAMCAYNPKSKQMLVKHIKQVHNGIKKFKCPTCDEDFFTESCLLRHQQQFHVMTDFQCEKCSQYFTTKQGLTRHWRICPLRIEGQDDIENSDLYDRDSINLDNMDDYAE